MLIDELQYSPTNCRYKVNSISWFANDGKFLDLGDNTLSVGGNLIIGNKVSEPIVNGQVEFSNGALL